MPRSRIALTALSRYCNGLSAIAGALVCGAVVTWSVIDCSLSNCPAGGLWVPQASRLRVLPLLAIASLRPGNYLGHIGAKKPHVKSGKSRLGQRKSCTIKAEAAGRCRPGPALMEFGGRYAMAAPRSRIWDALNDPEMLKAAIPGCSRIAWSGPGTLDLEIKVNLGIMSPTFKGELSLSDIVPAESYTLSGRGKGGMLGLAEGSADVVLADDGPGTILTFIAQGGASGQIMKMGKALIGNSAQRIIDGFFERFGKAAGVEVTPLGP
ncbi:hypothetical protein DMC47_01340 [Nostoc sp. 3335mG]|nr:hypothetical protein DMC47_01340 [Nostoc sp. 3335mG]